MTEAQIPQSAIANMAAMGPEARASAMEAFTKYGFKAPDTSATEAAGFAKVGEALASTPDTAPDTAPAAGPVTDALGLTGGPTAAGLQAEARAATEAILAAPVDGYKLEHMNANSLTSEELAAQDAEFKAGYAHMGLPASMVQSVTDALEATAAKYSLPNASGADFKASFMDEGAIIAGMSNSKEIVRLAQVAQDAMPADFKAWLSAKFAMHSAQAIVALSNVGLILELKARGKK